MAPLRQGTTSKGMEYSIHECPAKLRQEVGSVLRGVDLTKLLIVPTCQHAAVDLVQTGEKVDVEKDLLLEKFFEWAKKVTGTLESQGHWADYIDPCSGLPMIHQECSGAVYPEVEALTQLMQYKTSNAGCCKVRAVYPEEEVLRRCTLYPEVEALT
uniref:Uncharacterized protein n=1 Tax=Dunaliella tertiolecta TaxID=3047 RepID=A0A7S3QUV7_DUNTE